MSLRSTTWVAVALAPACAGLVLGGLGSTSVAGATPTCHGLAATLVVDSPDADTQGTDGDDVVVVTTPNVQVDTFDGVDVVCGRADDLLLHAGAGQDIVSMVSGFATTGRGPDLVEPEHPSQLSSGVSVAMGDGPDMAMVYNAQSMLVWGGGGRDTLSRRTPWEGIDDEPVDVVFRAGPGTDMLTFDGFDLACESPPRYDVTLSTSRHSVEAFGRIRFHEVDVFLGSPQADRMRGADDRRDRFLGGGGDDLLLGFSGRDHLVGNDGVDRADGGAGEDFCLAEQQADCETP